MEGNLLLLCLAFMREKQVIQAGNRTRFAFSAETGVLLGQALAGSPLPHLFK